MLNLDKKEVTIHLAGIHGTSTIQSKEVEVTLETADSTFAIKCTVLVNGHKKLAVEKEEYDLRPLKRKHGYLSCIRQNTVLQSQVKLMIEQNAFLLVCLFALGMVV